MAGNLSIKTYAELSGCSPSNCKQTLRWAHVSPKLTASRSEMLFSLLHALSSWLIFASVCVTHFIRSYPNPTAAAKRRPAPPAVKWGKYRLLWGYSDTQGVFRLK